MYRGNITMSRLRDYLTKTNAQPTGSDPAGWADPATIELVGGLTPLYPLGDRGQACQHNTLEVLTMTTLQSLPRCPVCGQIMYQVRRGATLKKRGPAYLCPKDEAETWTDETGRRHRLSESQHLPARRVWEPAELSEVPR